MFTAAAVVLWLAQTDPATPPVLLGMQVVVGGTFGVAALFYVRKMQKDYIATASLRNLELIAEVARKDAELDKIRIRCDQLEARCDELEDEVRHGQRIIETLRDLHAAADVLGDLLNPDIPDPPEDPES